MGEEEKNPAEKKGEEKKVEEEKKEEKKEKKAEEGVKEDKGGEDKKGEEKKDEAAAEPPPPPPPEEWVLRVFMHCEGCARKVRRCLKGFPGVEDVKTDCKTHKVVVKGKDADPLKVVERVQKKSGRKVELLTPLPKPKPEEPKKVEEEKKPKPEEKKEEPPVILAVLKVHMHCEACAQEIKKRILKMKGVQSAEPELKTSQVSVKGVFDPPKLVEYVYKRTGKHAVIVKQEPEKEGEKAEGEEKKEEKKSEGGGGGEKEKDKEKKGEGEGGEGGGEKGENKKEGEEAKGGEEETMKTVEVKKNEFYYYHPRYAVEYAYPPQIFSDENPNACSVM